MTTRWGLMRSISEVHGGVRPTWLHGSRVMYHVLFASNGRFESAMFRHALTSACSLPACSCQPSPMTWQSSETMTQPTIGLGATVRAPLSASIKARSMCRRSSGVHFMPVDLQPARCFSTTWRSSWAPHLQAQVLCFPQLPQHLRSPHLRSDGFLIYGMHLGFG